MNIDSLTQMVLDGHELNIKMDELQQAARLLSKCSEVQTAIVSILGVVEGNGPLVLDEARPVLEDAVSLRVKLNRAEELKEKIQAAQVFADLAQPILKCASSGPVPLVELGKALQKANEFSSTHGFHTKEMDELWQLDSKTRLTWLSQCVLAEDTSGFVENGRDELPLQCLDNSLLEPLKGRFTEAVQRQTRGNPVPLQERPSIDDGEALLQVAQTVQIDGTLRERLSQELNKGRQWCERFWRACHGSELLDPNDLMTWMEEAQTCPFCLDGVVTLEGKLKIFSEWQQKAKEVCAFR